jgi:hypothetical protein
MPDLAERQTAEPAGHGEKEVPEGGLNPHELALTNEVSNGLGGRDKTRLTGSQNCVVRPLLCETIYSIVIHTKKITTALRRPAQ